MKKRSAFLSLLFLLWASSARSVPVYPETDSRLQFRYLSVNDGLAQFSVQSFVLNRNGVVMIGTYDGISYFDGYSVISERRSDDRPGGLVNNRILCMSENRDGNVWIGMDGALMRYECLTGRYTDYTYALQELASQRVRTVLEDRSGELWIGTDQEVARGTVHASGRLTLRTVEGTESLGIQTVVEDRAGEKWIATIRGLYRYRGKGTDTVARRIERFSSRIRSLCYDEKGILWIGSSRDLWMSMDGKNFSKVDFPRKERSGLDHIVRDRDDRLWLGTNQTGLISLQLDENNRVVSAEHYGKDDFFGRLTDNTVSGLYIDRHNVLWVGTRRGVNYADLTPPDIHTFKPLLENRFNELGYEGRHIESLLIDSFGTLWISAYHEGLYRYDFATRRLYDLTGFLPARMTGGIAQPEPGVLLVSAHDGVYRMEISATRIVSTRKLPLTGISEADRRSNKLFLDVCTDRYGDIWIATPKGLIRYFPKSGTHVTYTKHHGLVSSSAYSLLSDPDDDVIWMGSADRGISRIRYRCGDERIDTGTIRQQDHPRGLGSDQIWCLYRSRDDIVWIGTDAGLSRMEERHGEPVSVSRIDAPYLKNAKILAITEDLHGNLWLNSSQGLYHYSPLTGRVVRYSSEDGMQSNTWTDGAAISENGWIFVGGINGINYFNPAKFHPRSHGGRPVFTSLSVCNEPVAVGEPLGGRTILTRHIDTTERITLDYRRNSFALRFTSDHYARSSKNRFRYKLEGYDRQWTETGYRQQTASYAHLDAGNYTFLLQSASDDGNWSTPPRRLAVTVLPPLWQTWWAKLLYLLSVLGLIAAVLSYILSRQRWRHRLVVQKMEQKQEQELNRIRLDFYTNITHELRTPLALIMAPLKDLLERPEADEYGRFRLNLIQKNAKNLLRLINQLLDIRRVSARNVPLAVSPYDLESVVRETIRSFTPLEEQTGIAMHFETVGNLPRDTWFDRDHIEKILRNLLSNAYKFTPPHGHILTRLWTEERNGIRFASISVRDSGVGIPAHDIGRIFDLFHHGTPLHGHSSGVGLALVKALVESHRGEITVSSMEGAGSVFTVSFPVERDSYPAEQRKERPDDGPESSETSPEEIRNPSTVPDTPVEEMSGRKQRTVLIVEDNEDMQAYMQESLKRHFNTALAVDGEEALSIARRIRPDIVVSDLRMPVMDGIEMIRRMKADPRTNYIPIIVHTGMEDRQSVREAMTAGAQEYILKPFDAENLLFRITNLLSSREHFARKLQAEKIVEPPPIEVPSSDEQLLRKIGQIVERNMQDPSFGTEQLAAGLGMSRMQLYRRTKHLPGGKTVPEIIRDIRIKRAGQLLASGQMRVSEAMYEVGIRNHTRFIKYFQEAYGTNPREYVRTHARTPQRQE